MANHLGTVHHEIHFTVQEGLDAIRDVIYHIETYDVTTIRASTLDAIRDVIYHIETYDVTTIRASTPMYLMSRKIKAMGIKMVLSGEGSDEVFGGYLYFHKAPNAKELHEETVRKLLALHMYDCARANKAMSAWGVEARVPFLDKKFLDVAMRINPQDKMCGNGKMEKHILRECFESYLPASVAWRQKEQFSDGVGYSYCMKRRCVNCWPCICMTARAPTKRCQPGAWKHAFRSSTKNSLMWRCALTRRIKCAVTAKWKNTSCVNVLSHTCPQAWPGGRKSSSPMASVTVGSTP